ncbi:hypothetical protein PVAP13_7NG226051 [Panicum virgatum]|uniref:GT-1/4-like C-terminal domain-containing protein n=1 Tax=Panicum virgatum TaxID=38727 RepID=A0A8T0Q9M9_PANVG|nr:hypothetical protein PVAP13_7NG226051 [Panicum virgatum]
MFVANGRSILSIDDRLEDERHQLPLTAADAVATNGVNPWNWRDTSTNGGDNRGTFGGRVILVKWGAYTKRIVIDGTSEAIKEAIKSAFGLRTRRAFWLEDEDEVVLTLDRDTPIGTYTLHLDDASSPATEAAGSAGANPPNPTSCIPRANHLHRLRRRLIFCERAHCHTTPPPPPTGYLRTPTHGCWHPRVVGIMGLAYLF